MSKEQGIRLPRPCWWPEPITAEQYEAFTPEKLELVSGYLIDGPDSAEERNHLLALLLRNCGLDRAVRLADPVLWKEALERWELYGDYRLDDDERP